jgi:hypothetical protein
MCFDQYSSSSNDTTFETLTSELLLKFHCPTENTDQVTV